VIRVVMSYTLPVAAVPGLGGALWPVTFVVLQVLTNTYYHFAGLNRMLGARWLARSALARRRVAGRGGLQRRRRGGGRQCRGVDERAAVRPGLHGLVQRAALQVL
jgi:hypothetical protein